MHVSSLPSPGFVGHLFLAYLATYSVGRLGIETLRIDAATEVFGARINIWIYLAVLIVSAASVRRREPTPHGQPALVG